MVRELKNSRATTRKNSSDFSRFYEPQSEGIRCVNFQPMVCPDRTKSESFVHLSI
ncbi:DUF1661 domain-containing protein [Porphyromonas gulae]|uniref:DUF1661 domain-containing protein n=1 Tax=Porphyromonas gulae TaxID=111105 RepID=UPI001E5CF07B|nr:DUF1661 domain-containing protein [Porphyromonas gulae]